MEIANIIYTFTIIILCLKFYEIGYFETFIISLHFISIYFINGFLFDINYMPDQVRYFEVSSNLRNFNFFSEENFYNGNTVYFSSLFFAFFPIPFINSIYSISIINFLLYLIIFVFLFKKGFFKSKLVLYFYLFYPSLWLYSAVSLRDMLVFFLMFFITYILLFNRYKVFFVLSSIFLYLIKYQNLMFIFLSFVFSKSLNKKFYLISIFFILYLFFFNNLIIEKLNFYKEVFYNNLNYERYGNFFDILLNIFPSFIQMLFKPFIWIEFSILKFFQFIENCILFIFVLFIWYKNYKYRLYKEQEIIFLNFFFLFSLSIYGLVLLNSGTIVRYKFPIVGIYIIYSLYFIYQSKINIEKD